MKLHSAKDVQKSMKRHVLFGALIFVFITLGLGGWAGTAQLAGAVIANGTVVVDSNVKKVQHPTGGVVGELSVKEGDHVQAGQVVIKLDETQTRANLAVLVNGINELLAREARLDAERSGAEQITFSEELLAQKTDLRVEKIIVGEQKHFELRRVARMGQKNQLRERIAQLEEQIQGLNEQIAAKDGEIVLVHKELAGIRQLWDKQLIAIGRLTEMEREATKLGGEKGELVASVAEAKGKIAEVSLQIIQVDQDMRSEDAQEIAEIRGKLAELKERKITAEDQLRRVEIRAPQAGRVHELAIHTVGGVVAPGDPLMLIVPDNDALIVEAKVDPKDIDQIKMDQLAELRFSAFNQRTTPTVLGHVTRIAADVIQDPHSDNNYYVIRVGIEPEEIKKLKQLQLVPGMPVEVFVQTEPQTMLSYLMKPLKDQVARTFREG